MNTSEIKNKIVSSLDDNPEHENNGDEIISLDFSNGFTERVLNNIYEIKYSVESEFSGFMRLAFSRIAITGVAAIVLLLISIFLMEGSISLNSLIGLSNTQEESIVCLLTGTME